MNFCELHQAFVPFETDYPVDVSSTVPQHLRSDNKDSQIPPTPANGGLYNAPQAVGPHASIPVAPTATNYIYNNLKSAGPPPGAQHQFIGTNRLGNNYISMPNVYWLNNKDKGQDNKYSIKVVHDEY
jgi:hypothetical protein